ncbi:hypothetical protein CHELA40_14526 [Chelatococcus asaccharovorans]|nr:hypothetical protein CHELA17_61094 [Chelatococcus asaccharovorans]CAH1678147.1 hypothetical protein CHELA40_14526 [Chelatococcus asaccharovorans]
MERAASSPCAAYEAFALTIERTPALDGSRLVILGGKDPFTIGGGSHDGHPKGRLRDPLIRRLHGHLIPALGALLGALTAYGSFDAPL